MSVSGDDDRDNDDDEDADRQRTPIVVDGARGNLWATIDSGDEFMTRPTPKQTDPWGQVRWNITTVS